MSDRRIQVIIGLGAIAAPLLHTLTDIAEWIAGGFTSPQLWANYVSFILIPFVMVGLFAAQRPRISTWGLLGALLYGASFVYFTHTTLYAVSQKIPNYEVLWATLGVIYTVHGIVMILGGLIFGWASHKARVFPPWASIVFMSGIVVNLLLTAFGAPELLQTLGSALRNLGLIGMGAFLVRQASMRQRNA